MFDLCMFDLDDTLVRTDDMTAVREACKNSVDPDRVQAVQAQLPTRANRHIYGSGLLQQIRKAHPNLKLGVFTRAPRSYAETVLAWAYPGFIWDVVVAYEDVERTKPYGDGIGLAMDKFGFRHLSRVMMVGDNVADVRAAYNCGCLVTLDKSAWPSDWPPEAFWALEKVPDATINTPDQLLDVLTESERHLPELERLMAGASTPSITRFDKINHFMPKELGRDDWYPVFVCGRFFASHESLSERRKWHRLTKSVVGHKEADLFPNEWIRAIRNFITKECSPTLWAPVVKILVSVVPHRPGREPRLERLLHQLQKSISESPLPKREVFVAPDLFAYKEGVKSQHKDVDSRVDRFKNVRDHLFVRRPDLIKPGVCNIIIDDVCTTGASLIYATKYLRGEGATNVKCLALAKNVGDVLPWN